MMKDKIHKIIYAIIILILISVDAYCFDLEKKVIKTKFKNGLTVLMMERRLSPTVSLYIRHHIGAVDEKQGETGAAHFLEHMMFKGTTTIGTKNYNIEQKIIKQIESVGNSLDREKRKGEKANIKKIALFSRQLKKLQAEHRKYFIPNELDRLYTENGGLDMNASTGYDFTTYHISLPVNKIELWARLESDRLLNPVFREFYTERDVIMEERRQRVETNPLGKLYEHFLSTAYKIHPYGRPILGWPQDMMYLSPRSIKNIYSKYKSPENMVIAVVGDIDPAATLNLINKYFGRIPRIKPVKSVIPAEPEQNGERRVTIDFDAAPTLLIGYHKPTAPVYEDYVFDVLETMLTKGRTSRLFKLLVTDMEIAQNVGASNGIPGSRYSNLFVISANPRFPNTNKELERVILQEIEKIKTTTVADDELAKAKNHLKMGYIRSLNSNSEIAAVLSYYESLFGDYRYFADYMKMIDKITAKDIQDAAQKYLNTENRTVAELINNKKD